MLVQFVEVSERGDPAVDEDHGMIGEATELCGVVGDPHERHTGVGEFTSQVFDRAPRRGVERCSRFVGQEHERLGQQRSCDRHALRFAPAELVGRPIEQFPGHADVIEHMVRTVEVEPRAGPP